MQHEGTNRELKMYRKTIVKSVSATVAALWLSGNATAQDVKPAAKEPAAPVKVAPAVKPVPAAPAAKVTPGGPQKRPFPAPKVTPVAPQPTNSVTKMRALTQEQQKLMVDIRTRERELQEKNETVKGKLAELDAKRAALQEQLRGLYESRSGIYTEADPDLAKLYERQKSVREELSVLRTQMRSSRRSRYSRPGTSGPQVPRRPTMTRPGAKPGDTPVPMGPPMAPGKAPTLKPAAPKATPAPGPAVEAAPAKPTK